MNCTTTFERKAGNMEGFFVKGVGQQRPATPPKAISQVPGTLQEVIAKGVKSGDREGQRGNGKPVATPRTVRKGRCPLLQGLVQLVAGQRWGW